MIVNHEVETDKGLNQISTWQWVRDTRQGSHYNTLCNLLNIYNATHLVLKNVIDNGSTCTQ